MCAQSASSIGDESLDATRRDASNGSVEIEARVGEVVNHSVSVFREEDETPRIDDDAGDDAEGIAETRDG